MDESIRDRQWIRRRPWAKLVVSVSSFVLIVAAITHWSEITHMIANATVEGGVRYWHSTPNGIPHDAPVYIYEGDNIFKIPAAYFWKWPDISIVNKKTTPAHHGIFFMFWMPDARPIEDKSAVFPNTQPSSYKEPGRSPPRDDEYPVVVAGLQILRSYNDDFITPEKQLGNIIGNAEYLLETKGRGGIVVDKVEFGVRYFRLGAPFDGKDYYASETGSDIQFFLRCFNRPSAPATPWTQCLGDVFVRSSGLRYNVRVPYSKIEHLQSVFEVIQKLSRSWLQGAQK